jgi:hypothetical protein
VSPRAQADKKAATCDKVLEEIVSTERLYLANLQQVVSVYIKPLKDHGTQAELGLRPQQVSTIFSNLEGIVGFHAILHEELAACLKSQPADPDARVAKMAAIFNKYGDFCQSTSCSTIQSASLSTLCSSLPFCSCCPYVWIVSAHVHQLREQLSRIVALPHVVAGQQESAEVPHEMQTATRQWRNGPHGTSRIWYWA